MSWAFDGGLKIKACTHWVVSDFNKFFLKFEEFLAIFIFQARIKTITSLINKQGVNKLC